MSRLFGPMRQVGIVVRDIEKAMRHWVEVCGVGPWFYAEQLPMDDSATRAGAMISKFRSRLPTQVMCSSS